MAIETRRPNVYTKKRGAKKQIALSAVCIPSIGDIQGESQ
jgi:hypothetical protein